MKSVIDFSLFQYKCINFEKNDVRVTSKTDIENVENINQYFFDFLKDFNYSVNILKDFFYKKDFHYHEVKDFYKELICELFEKAFGYNKIWVEQIISLAQIFQIKIKKEIRMFFLREQKSLLDNTKIYIVKPLFLDVNHAIYNDKKYEKIYQACWVCRQKECN